MAMLSSSVTIGGKKRVEVRPAQRDDVRDTLAINLAMAC